MKTIKLTVAVPSDFNFWHTVYSHGWCALPPFAVIKDRFRLQRVLEFPSRKAIVVEISQSLLGKLTIEVLLRDSLFTHLRESIIAQAKTCLRLEEDYSAFYAEARKHKRFQWIPKVGAGRLLRAPTVFEDAAKMICTTNCSWALTEVMVENLCRKLGRQVADHQWTFPQPEAIADVTERFLRNEIRAGYRAPYLLELARRTARGELDLESWCHSELPTEELYKHIRSVKGIGPYAAGNILKLLGRYDYLALDSWCQRKFFEIHKNGRKTSDSVIEKFYEPFGKWKGLFFWLDVTKHWYDHEFPF